MGKELKVFNTDRWLLKVYKTDHELFATVFWDKRKPATSQMVFLFETYELALCAALTLMFDRVRGK